MVQLVVAYGSQTGCAKDIAEAVYAAAAPLSPTLITLNDHKKIKWNEGVVLLVVVSTTGNGEPPENAERCWRFLRRRSHPPTLFEHVYYSVLALGDTNYTKFCYAGKNFHRRLAELGAVPIQDLVCADDALGLEAAVEPWRNSILTVIQPVMDSLAAGRAWVADEGAEDDAGAGADADAGADAGDAKAKPPAASSTPEPGKPAAVPDAVVTATTVGVEAPVAPEKPSVPVLAAGAGAGGASAATPSADTPDDALDGAFTPNPSSYRLSDGLTNGVLPFEVLFPGDPPALPKRLPKAPPVLFAVAPMATPPFHRRRTSTTLTTTVAGSGAAAAAAAAAPGGSLAAAIDTATTTGGAGAGAGAGAASGAGAAANSDADHADEATPLYSAASPFVATLTDARYLTAGGAQAARRVLRLELNVSGSDMEYAPGDSIGISCPNEADAVDFLLPRLGYGLTDWVVISTCADDGKAKGNHAALPREAPVADLFLYHLDFTSVPKKTFVRMLADHCSDAREQHVLSLLSSRDGRDQFRVFVEAQRLTLLDLLALFPSCNPPLAALLSALPPLQPRYYSIASSPLQHPESIVIALSVVTYVAEASSDAATARVQRRGLCSHWLERRCAAHLDPAIAVPAVTGIPVFRKPTRDFRLPGNLERPIVMVGPGTGVAPFVGFLQHRRRRVQMAEHNRHSTCIGSWRSGVDVEVVDHSVKPLRVGDALLFFGNQRRDQDFLFQDELEAFVGDGTLSALHTAFSREQDHKVYVQHRLLEHAAAVAELVLHKNAFVYVCGDGAHMAKDVHAAFVEVLQSTGLSADEAMSTMGLLRRQHRYVEDIWS